MSHFRKLSVDQAVQVLHSGENLIIEGAAGTGKTTAITAFLSETERNVLLTSPTVHSVRNGGGYLLDTIFDFEILNHSVPDRDSPPAGNLVFTAPSRPGFRLADPQIPYGLKSSAMAQVVAHLDTLIVEDAASLSAQRLDLVCRVLAAHGPKPGGLFGGVQVVLVADLLAQRPEDLYHDASWVAPGHRYQSPHLFSAACLESDNFLWVRLTEQ